ncbi:unnamed protein product [Rotaria sp. Silwood2]|nr:unnamed protein product [Rotaria sp. Silwood2]CAF4653772.1 unnamed protein product [Rotaria sp. Silwood2]
MFDANEWEILITSSLPFLNIFKFKFGCHRTYEDFVVLNFKQFQTDFWVKQHQWCTQILFEKFLLYTHTVPYLSNIFKLELNSRKSSNELVNVSSIFDKVTNLTLSHEQITDKCLYRFPNLISLKIVILEQEIIDSSISKYLKMIVNLSNLKHLDISQYQRLILSGELLIILKESSQLSSLTINPKDLILLFSDNELCEYLNKMIKKLNMYKHDHSLFDDLNEMKIFCRIFSNIEQVKCSINQPERILFLLCRL